MCYDSITDFIITLFIFQIIFIKIAELVNVSIKRRAEYVLGLRRSRITESVDVVGASSIITVKFPGISTSAPCSGQSAVMEICPSSKVVCIKILHED